MTRGLFVGRSVQVDHTRAIDVEIDQGVRDAAGILPAHAHGERAWFGIVLREEADDVFWSGGGRIPHER